MNRSAFGTVVAAIAVVAILSCGDDGNDLVCPDSVRPTAVRDLAVEVLADSAFLLTWTAPGDDGDQGGAAAYDLRYSARSDSEPNWWDSLTVALDSVPLPGEAGVAESLVVPGLAVDSTYWFAIRSTDDDGNESELSNVASNLVQGPPRAIRVRPDGTGDYGTIQDAVNAAVEGDTIYLADGTYRGDGNRDIDLLGKNILIWSESLDPELCVIDCEGSEAEPHRGFFIPSGNDRVTWIRAVTIRNGYAEEDGGAVLCDSDWQSRGAYPWISYCVVESCFAREAGGGIYCRNHSSLVVQECTFVGNSSGRGGAIASSSAERIAMYSCLFRGNTCVSTGAFTGSGGALSFNGDGHVQVSFCTFESNSAKYDGGAVSNAADYCEIYKCSFQSNSGRSGAALEVYGLNECVVTESEFVENICDVSGWSHQGGAGISCEAAHLSVDQCTFVRNEAVEHYTSRGAGIYCKRNSSVNIEASTFVGNKASVGGGIAVAGNATVSILRCQVVNAESGGAIDVDSLAAFAVGCSNLYGNAGGDWAGGLVSLLGMNGNISADPLFCDPGSDDYRLQPDSPCSADSSACGRMGAWEEGCE